MKKAAQELSQDAAGDFLFLLPNLIVADKGITGLPKNAITESFDLAALARRGVSHAVGSRPGGERVGSAT